MPTSARGVLAFEAVAATASSGIDFELSPDAKGFQKHWLFVDASTRSPLLLTPRTPVVPSSSWGHMKLVDRWLARVWKWLAGLQKLGMTVLMVVREFVWWPIALLQCHSRPMWAFTVPRTP